MNYKEFILSTATLSIGVIGNASAADFSNNQNDYIKLASILPIIESDAGISVVPDETSDDNKIKERCVAKGYVESLDCENSPNPTLTVAEKCQETGVGANFIKCTCYGNLGSICEKLEFSNNCKDKKGYVPGTEQCEFNEEYVKCIADPCDNYVSSCGTGFTKSSDTCLSGTKTMYKCTIKICDGYVSSCGTGYLASETCQEGSTTKYKCTVDPCTGFGAPCASGYVSAGKCQSGTTTKYKCTANPCTDYNYTSCPSGYVSAGTCLSGTTTKYKCNITNAQKCKDADYIKTSCPAGYALTTKCSYDGAYYKTCNITNAQRCINDSYVKGKTCDAGHSTHQKRSACTYDGTYYKCVAMSEKEACNNDGYFKTSCSSGYALTNKCAHGSYFKTCNITSDQKCINDGFSKSVTSCGPEIITPPPVSDEVKCFDLGYIYDKCDYGIADFCTYKSNLLTCKQDNTSCDSECRSFGYNYGTTAYNCCMGTASISRCQIPDYNSGLMQTYRVCLQGGITRPDGALGIVNSEATNLGYRPGKLNELLGDHSLSVPIITEELKTCDYNSSYKKCVPIDNSKKCSDLGYSSTEPKCTVYQKLSSCKYLLNYRKCVDMTVDEKCIEDGYTKSSCAYGVTKIKCPHGGLLGKCEKKIIGSTCEEICDNDYRRGTNEYNCCMGLSGINCARYRQCVISEPTECSSTPSLNNARCAELGYSPYINCGSGVFKTSCPCDNTKSYAKCSGGTSQLSLSR